LEQNWQEKSLLMLWMLYFDGLQECYGLSADDFLATLFQNSNVIYLYVTTQFDIHLHAIFTGYSSLLRSSSIPRPGMCKAGTQSTTCVEAFAGTACDSLIPSQ
jgi:hypothetical protein